MDNVTTTSSKDIKGVQMITIVRLFHNSEFKKSKNLCPYGTVVECTPEMAAQYEKARQEYIAAKEKEAKEKEADDALGSSNN